MLLVSTKNQDLRERLHKGTAACFDEGRRLRLQSRLPEATPRQQKMGHRPTARNAPARHNHEIVDKYRGHVRAARMLCWSSPELAPKSEKNSLATSGLR